MINKYELTIADINFSTHNFSKERYLHIYSCIFCYCLPFIINKKKLCFTDGLHERKHLNNLSKPTKMYNVYNGQTVKKRKFELTQCPGTCNSFLPVSKFLL